MMSGTWTQAVKGWIASTGDPRPIADVPASHVLGISMPISLWHHFLHLGLARPPSFSVFMFPVKSADLSKAKLQAAWRLVSSSA